MDINNQLMVRARNLEEIRRNQKLTDFIYHYNFDIVQSNGQRISNPRNKHILPKPSHGSEVFVGKIPRHIFEDELIPLFERIGKVYQFRLMLDFSGLNRGFAFVTYMNPRQADLAVECLNNHEIRRNRYIGVYKSIDNCRLFVGGVPVNITKEEIVHKLNEYVDDITNVIMYPAHIDGHVNRGYVFVEFSSHRMAAMARRQLGSGVVLWDNPLAVDWADPIPQVAPEIMNQVTKLYIRNLPIKLSEDTLRMVLENILEGTSTIVKVHKVNDYAFVHFNNRTTAERALEVLQHSKCFGNQIEVTWARPPKYSKQNRLNAPAENFCVSVPPRMRKIVQEMKTANQSSAPRSTSSGSPSTSFSCGCDEGRDDSDAVVK
ncbi:hypothetical protein RN001_015007 [Aquatica leii]|uniref:RRM domain-containing protein n=1 Tax=Aquatica leii TaxID=1421715 RepID=A0AAN7P183_9COLE|nr:hypothetical protein RN001_015007 [Aquatica leii]